MRIVTHDVIFVLHTLAFCLMCLRNSRMKNEDIKLELFENSSPEITLTITHIPTGITVSGKGEKRFQLKNDLLNELMDLVRENRGNLSV